MGMQFPKFKLPFGLGPTRYAGVDIGSDSAKVVQLRKDRERAVLETYGELKSARYFEKQDGAAVTAFPAAREEHIANLLTDIFREANVTARHVAFSIPATASFVTLIRFPLLPRQEIEAAIPFEAKKYIPIPLEEVALDWEVIAEDERAKYSEVLLAAVPGELVAKYRRVAEIAHLTLEAVEIESFSLARSLLDGDRGVSAIVNWGAGVITLTVVDQRRIRANNNIGRGAQEITLALARSLGITLERAEALKRDVGLSDKPEEREIADIISPIVDGILADLERAVASYNRITPRKIEKIVLTGGGAGLAGLVNYTAKRFGLETAIGNPFHRTVFPAFLAPVLREIAPNFAVAVGLALRPITTTP